MTPIVFLVALFFLAWSAGMGALLFLLISKLVGWFVGAGLKTNRLKKWG